MTVWTVGEKHLVAAAAYAAPSVHNTRPWVVEFGAGQRDVCLYERLDRALPRHDPLGRDRLISCGAALAHMIVAVRMLGWTTETELFPDPAHPDLVGKVSATGRAEPADVDRAAYHSMSARHSHRKPFARTPVPAETRALLLAANRTDGVGLRVVSDVDADALAKVLSHSALVLRADRTYQRELVAWTSAVRDPTPGDGVSTATRHTATLPWAGLVRPNTAVPDVGTLANRLRSEFLVLVETPDDGPVDHVRAGMAAEQVWLAATAAGLSGSVLTQPFQLPESRAGLVESLDLNGFPQLMLRFGLSTDHREER
jgi:hypothetical protein